jgi:uncharacterized membrane protein YebE (DUF533 family)
MSNEPLEERRKALENSFFAKQEEKLLTELRAKQAAEFAQQHLVEASGISDETLIRRLIELGIAAETLAALSLAPLVAVAWADGTVDAKERSAILAAAAELGILPSHVGHRLVEAWLDKPPGRDLLTTWIEYVGALAEELTPAELHALRDDLLRRARGVAEITGGLLGLGNRISKTEQAVLDRLAAAFD